MKVKAVITDGEVIEVTYVSVWYDHEVTHKVSFKAIHELLLKARETGNMQVYSRGYLTGYIDAFDSTPLYTNGQTDVVQLIVDGQTVWSTKN